MECVVGQIQLFAFGFAPDGWILCNGATLQISMFQALFSVIGFTYGGNGNTTFAVPDLRGARPLNVDTNYMCYYIATSTTY